MSILLGVAGSLCISEFALRFVGPPWLQLRMTELNAGEANSSFGSDAKWPVERIDGEFLRFVPGSQFPVAHYEYNHVAHIDSFGGRVTHSSGRDTRTCRRIVFLGDSFTFGVGVPDSATFVSLLDRNPGICLLNLGVPGSSLPPQLDILARRHAELGCPSLYVIVFFAGNDILDTVREHDRGSRTPTGPAEPAPPTASRIDQALFVINGYVYHNWLLKRSYTLQLVRFALLLGRNRLADSSEMYQLFRSASSHAEFRRHAANSLDEELTRLDKLSITDGFQVMFIVIPDVYQVYAELRRTKLAQYHLSDANLDVNFPSALLEEKVTEHGYRFVDTLPCLQDAGPGLYYAQDTHLTERGHQVVASCISAAVDAEIQHALGASAARGGKCPEKDGNAYPSGAKVTKAEVGEAQQSRAVAP